METYTNSCEISENTMQNIANNQKAIFFLNNLDEKTFTVIIREVTENIQDTFLKLKEFLLKDLKQYKGVVKDAYFFDELGENQVSICKHLIQNC